MGQCYPNFSNFQGKELVRKIEDKMKPGRGYSHTIPVEGDRGAEAQENRDRRGTGGGRRKGGKLDSQNGRNQEKRRKISQYCITFHNINRTKRQEPLRKGVGGGSFRPPCLPSHTYMGMCRPMGS